MKQSLNISTVLVVDDNENNLKVASNTLKECGYNIALAFDGNSALEIIEQISIDLILLDIMMPVIDGFEVCRKLKLSPRTKDIPVIFLTASNENVVKAFEVGGVDYIIKPFVKHELIARVHTHLQLKNAREELYLNNRKLEAALKRSDDLLYNVLPKRIADDFKNTGYSEPDIVTDVSMLVTDLVNFTKISSKTAPNILFSELNSIFASFDSIIRNNGGERIKTIGDAYFCACGLTNPLFDHAEKCIDAALEMCSFIESRKNNASIPWEIRVGVHSGTLISGVVGTDKFIFDVFGNDVNTVFRMETNSDPMKINVSQQTYAIIKDKYKTIQRPEKEVKGLGFVSMYFIEHKL